MNELCRIVAFCSLAPLFVPQVCKTIHLARALIPPHQRDNRD